MNGMVVKVEIIEKQKPRAPRIPNFLFQKPRQQERTQNPFGRTSQK
jgi:hypothetical protein